MRLSNIEKFLTKKKHKEKEVNGLTYIFTVTMNSVLFYS
jgi:hypothetical protein